MNYLSDLHTHSLASGHAYTTLMENISFAEKKGIKILGTSEHGPSMPDGPHPWYFGNIKVLPRVINDVILLKGCETNILNTDGKLDLEEYYIDNLDYLIASFHEPCFPPLNNLENTKAIINTIEKNSKVEILGHLGNPNYDLNYIEIIKKAKENNIMIEINNSSIKGVSRKGSEDNCKNIAKLCIDYGTKIIVTSDAHFADHIGVFDEAITMLHSIRMPEELIMNDPKKLIEHFHKKGKLLDVNL